MTVSQAIDYERWLLAEYLEPWQCVALTLGINPLDGLLPGYQNSIEDLYDEVHLFRESQAAAQRRAPPAPEFAALVETLERGLSRLELAVSYKGLDPDKPTQTLIRGIEPLKYVVWAQEHCISLPPPMDKLARDLIDSRKQSEARDPIDFSELTLTFHATGLLKADLRGNSKWLHPLQLGLINPQSRKPNQSFKILSAWFAGKCVDNPTVRKRAISELRSRLKKSLYVSCHIEGNPILHSKERGYYPAFKFRDLRDNEQRRQGENAKRYETPYDDEMYYGLSQPKDGYPYYESRETKDDAAADFLREKGL
jgi:hypothetical protein